MGLFSKKKEEPVSCCCGGNCTPETMAQAEAVKSSGGVKVLGSGCAKCKVVSYGKVIKKEQVKALIQKVRK